MGRSRKVAIFIGNGLGISKGRSGARSLRAWRRCRLEKKRLDLRMMGVTAVYRSSLIFYIILAMTAFSIQLPFSPSASGSGISRNGSFELRAT